MNSRISGRHKGPTWRKTFTSSVTAVLLTGSALHERAAEMAWWLKVLVTKPEDLLRREQTPPRYLLTSMNAYYRAACTDRHHTHVGCLQLHITPPPEDALLLAGLQRHQYLCSEAPSSPNHRIHIIKVR